jgi:hypothetical protein
MLVAPAAALAGARITTPIITSASDMIIVLLCWLLISYLIFPSIPALQLTDCLAAWTTYLFIVEY